MLPIILASCALAASPASAEPWYEMEAAAGLGNMPRAAFEGGGVRLDGAEIGLAETQVTGRLPRLSLSIGEQFSSTLRGVVSGAISQELFEFPSNPDRYAFYLNRLQWRRLGNRGFNPLWFAELENVYLEVADPERNGYMRFGQVDLPFGYRTSSWVPPVAVAPNVTPMTEYLSLQGPGLYMNSTVTRWRDIGVLLVGNPAPFGYAVGLVNGSGPNRLDENGEKDWFGRLDWKPSETEEIGVSAQMGQDVAFPLGFDAPPIEYGRRRWGVHGRVTAGDSTLRAEWARNWRIGLDPEPRDGWYLDVIQSIGDQQLYVQYSTFGDPAVLGRGYQIRQATAGTVTRFAENLEWRIEYVHRWEESGGIRDSYGQYLTHLQARLGRGPESPRQAPFPGMPMR